MYARSAGRVRSITAAVPAFCALRGSNKQLTRLRYLTASERYLGDAVGLGVGRLIDTERALLEGAPARHDAGSPHWYLAAFGISE